MKKRITVLLIAVFVISLITGCAGKKANSSVPSTELTNSQAAETEADVQAGGDTTPIDQEKLDSTMSIIERC